MTSSVARRPPGWMTRLPSRARNAYGSSRAISGRAVSRVLVVGIVVLRWRLRSVAEGDGAVVTDPLPHGYGAAEFGVLEQLVGVELAGVEADRAHQVRAAGL